VSVGMIHVKEALDRETQQFYWLTVYAADSAPVPRSSFVDVLIEIDDVNDNRFAVLFCFSKSSYVLDTKMWHCWNG